VGYAELSRQIRQPAPSWGRAHAASHVHPLQKRRPCVIVIAEQIGTAPIAAQHAVRVSASPSGPAPRCLACLHHDFTPLLLEATARSVSRLPHRLHRNRRSRTGTSPRPASTKRCRSASC
jgi:hypothetical protein